MLHTRLSPLQRSHQVLKKILHNLSTGRSCHHHRCKTPRRKPGLKNERRSSKVLLGQFSIECQGVLLHFALWLVEEERTVNQSDPNLKLITHTFPRSRRFPCFPARTFRFLKVAILLLVFIGGCVNFVRTLRFSINMRYKTRHESEKSVRKEYLGTHIINWPTKCARVLHLVYFTIIVQEINTSPSTLYLCR